MLLLPANAADVKKVCRDNFGVLSRTVGCGPVGAAWRHVTMDSGAFPLKSEYPVAIVGAGPVGLTTALALSYYQIPFVVFEANAGLSTETKAGTTLIRTLEIWQRFGAAGQNSVQGHAGRRNRRHRARDQPQARCRQAASPARRNPVSLRHQPAAVRHGARTARLPDRLEIRKSPSPASPHRTSRSIPTT